jgi:hypothetical protein
MAKKLLTTLTESDITYSLFSQPGLLGYEVLISLGKETTISRLNSILTHLRESSGNFAVNLSYRDISGDGGKNDMEISITYDPNKDGAEYQTYTDQFWGASGTLIDYLAYAEKTGESMLPGAIEFFDRWNRLEDRILEYPQYTQKANRDFKEYLDAFLAYACHSSDESYLYDKNADEGQIMIADQKARKNRRAFIEIEAKWEERRKRLKGEN